MKQEIEVEITRILPKRAIGTNGMEQREFRGVELVNGEAGKYPNVLPFVVKHSPNDKFNDLDKLNEVSVGDRVKFSFSIRGREWTNPQGEVRCFTDFVVCSKLVVTNRSTPAPAPANPTDADVNAASEPVEDLPF